MKIVVKRDLCCGAQLCVKIAPDLFRLDELGYNASDGDVVPQDMQALAQRCARACPELAIALEDD